MLLIQETVLKPTIILLIKISLINTLMKHSALMPETYDTYTHILYWKNVGTYGETLKAATTGLHIISIGVINRSSHKHTQLEKHKASTKIHFMCALRGACYHAT